MNTDKIQKAIESVVDDETASIPPIPLNGIPDEDSLREAVSGDGDSLGNTMVLSIDSKDASPAQKENSTDPIPLGNPLAGASISSWFFTFMCMNIPIIGWFYLIFLAFRKEKTDRQNFARAYLFYKLVFLLVAAIILGIVVYIGLGYLDMLLRYMDML